MSDRTFGALSVLTVGFAVASFLALPWRFALMAVIGYLTLLVMVFAGQEEE